MSKAFIDRNQQQNSNDNRTETKQAKIDPEVQLKRVNNQQIDGGWGIPAQMFAQEEEEESLQAKAEEEELMQGKLEDEELMQGKAEEEELQMKSGPEGEERRSDSIGTKTVMPDDVRGKMENSFGTDFSNVNILQNSDKAANIGALAYTQGNDVHFAPGQYNPGSTKGQELLGHELTHIVQQREGRVRPTKQGKGLAVNDNPELEKEADVMGERAAQGKMADIAGIGSGVQMKGEEKESDDAPTLSSGLDFAGLYQGRRVYVSSTPEGWFPVLKNLSAKVTYKGKSYSVYEFYLKGFILSSNSNGKLNYKGKYYSPPNNAEKTTFLNAVFHKNSPIVMPDMVRHSNPIDRVKVQYFDKEFMSFLAINQILIYEDLANKTQFIDTDADEFNKIDGIENIFSQTGAVLEQRGSEYLRVMIDSAVASAFKGLGYYVAANDYLEKGNKSKYDFYENKALNMILNSGNVIYRFLDLDHYPKPDTSLQSLIFNTMISVIPFPGGPVIGTILKTLCKEAFKEILKIIYSSNVKPKDKVTEICSQFTDAATNLKREGKLTSDDYTDAVTMFLSNAK